MLPIKRNNWTSCDPPCKCSTLKNHIDTSSSAFTHELVRPNHLPAGKSLYMKTLHLPEKGHLQQRKVNWLLFRVLLHYWSGGLVLGTLKVRYISWSDGESDNVGEFCSCVWWILVIIWNGIQSLFHINAVMLGYRSFFLKVYWATSSDQDFETEEPKRPNLKYLPSHHKLVLAFQHNKTSKYCTWNYRDGRMGVGRKENKSIADFSRKYKSRHMDWADKN